MKALRSLLSAILIVLLVCTMSFSAFAAYNDVDAANENLAKIEFADKLGLVPSTWNGDFNPDGYFTRADAVVAVYRMLYGGNIDASLYDTDELEFIISDDKGDIEEESVLAAYLKWAEDNYLITSNVEGAKFEPKEPITANEFLTILAKVLCLVPEADATYPDDYTAAVKDVAGKIKAGDDPVTREQAAVAFANALIAVDGKPGEVGVYADIEGEPLDCLAVKVFNMSSVNLVIRATKNNNLGYTVVNGTLLSNGADVNLGEDLSEYVGYGINLTYCDIDGSSTFTEDEKILAYSVSSTTSATVDASLVTITSGNSISIDSEAGSFTLGTSTYLYLNGEPWPVDDPDYDLVKLVPAVGHAAAIMNRPNLKFKCMQTANSTTLATVFATETRPGKIVGINNGYYSVYDYYKAGTDEAIKHFNVSNCTFASPVKVGDYVNFYETGDKCTFTAGTTIVSGITAREVSPDSPTDYVLTDGTTIKEHAFFTFGNTKLDINADGEGKQLAFVIADAEEKFMLTWENVQTNFAGLEVDSITPVTVVDNKGTDNTEDDVTLYFHEIEATNVDTKETVKFKVSYDDVDSATPIAVGDYIDYCDNGEKGADFTTYVKKTEPVTAHVTDMGDYFLDTATTMKYYKNRKYAGNLGTATDFTNGTATLNIDMANTVISIIAD